MKYLFRTFIFILASFLSSCNSNPTDVPLSGEVTYEVSYSEDILKGSSVGNFMPRTVVGIYDTSNVKLSLVAPLGVLKCNVVLSAIDDFVTLDFDRSHFVMSLAEFLSAGDSVDIAEMVRSIYMPDVDIAGYLSHHVRFVPLSNDSVDTRVDLFYVPTVNSNPDCQFCLADIFSRRRNRQSAFFGVVTAISVQIDDSNFMMMASKIRENNDIDVSEFSRPDGYIEASHSQLFDLYEALSSME